MLEGIGTRSVRLSTCSPSNTDMGTIYLLAVIFIGVVVAEPDPCLDGNHQTMNDTHRSAGYVIEHTLEGLCDNTLQQGWFRFVSEAGGEMPRACPPQYHCGTRMPLWLQTIPPSPNDGVTMGKACMNTGNDCCEHSMDIGVKNCGGFFVYFLRALPACPAAYCGGDKIPCRDGMTSSNGMEPGCYPITSPTTTTTTTTTTPTPTTTTTTAATTTAAAATYQAATTTQSAGGSLGLPNYTDTPTLSSPEVRGHSFRFMCDVNYSGPTDPDLMFEVEFTFDGQPDPNIPHRAVSPATHQVPLPGTLVAGHMGQKIGCRVRAYHMSNPTDKTPWRVSNQYPAQITLQATHNFVTEKGGNDTVTVTSTIPIVCDSIPDPSCCLHLMLDVNGPKNNLVVPHPCEVKLCGSDWNATSHTATTTFNVAAAKDLIRDGDQIMTLAFEKISSTGGGPYVDVFQNYQINSVQINVKDEPTRSCSWYGDPHYTMCNGHRFNLFGVGDFTTYRTHDNHFEMQSRTVRCNGHASCQCGLAIREGHDIIRIDNCHNTRHAPRVECNNRHLRHGTSVYRSRDGNNIMVYLPSGREVKVDCGHNYHNVHVTYPATDTNIADGVCGRMDQQQNTYYHPDGTQMNSPCGQTSQTSQTSGQTGHTNHVFSWFLGLFAHHHTHHRRRSSHSSQCPMPTAYTDAWRNPNSNSLFTNPPTTTTTTTTSAPSTNSSSGDTHYCQCDTGLSGSDPARIDCTPGADVTQHAQRCASNSCQNVTDSLPSFLQGSGWHRRRDVIYGDFDELDPPVDFGNDTDPSEWDLTWPTASGITEDQAYQKCQEALENSQLFQHCNSSAKPEFEDMHFASLDDCIVDILFGDNFDLVDSAIAGFTSSCQAELAQDPANYQTDNNGNMVLKETLTNVCPVACLAHGHCENGACVCQAGYTGFNCQLQIGVPPTLTKMRGPALCDINKRPCRLMYFEADHFESTDSFMCKVVSSHGQTTEEKAKFIGGDRLACPLPETNRSVTDFTVSVTTDGTHYSNSLSIKVYDSTCRECNEADGCASGPMPGTCLIEDQCHQNRDHKMSDATKMCDASVSTTDWTITDQGLYPVIFGKPTIVEPVPPDFIVKCQFVSPDHAPNARFRVTWIMDQTVLVQVVVLEGDQRETSLPMTDFPIAAHSVSCRVKSFFDGQSHESSEYASRPIPMGVS